MSMMMGIGTPSSQSSIPRPMSASFFDPVLIPVNGQASVSFRQITPLRQIIYAGKQVRLTTADRSAGGIAQGGLIHSHEAAPSDSRVDIRGLVDRARDLVHRFLDRILRVTSGALGVTLDLLRGSLSCNRSEPTTEPIPGLTDRLVRDARRTIQGAYRSTSSPIAGKSPRSSRAKLLDE